MITYWVILVLSFTVMEVFNKSASHPSTQAPIATAETKNIVQPYIRVVELPNEFAKGMVALNPPNERYINAMNGKLDDIQET